MTINTLTIQEAEEKMNSWIENGFFEDNLNQEDKDMRKQFLQIDENAKQVNGDTKRKKYLYDIRFGLLLYNYLNAMGDFNLRVASNDGFWRYLSLCIIPDIVGERWGSENRDHFYRKAVRIWLKSLWWFIHLSWQGNVNDTSKVLESPNLNTDIILQLQERPGRNGSFSDVYRAIVNFYSSLDPKVIENAKVTDKEGHDRTLFRTVMIMNTARVMVMQPSLYSGGVSSYTKMLFNEAGAKNVT